MVIIRTPQNSIASYLGTKKRLTSLGVGMSTCAFKTCIILESGSVEGLGIRVYTVRLPSWIQKSRYHEMYVHDSYPMIAMTKVLKHAPYFMSSVNGF